MAGRSALGAMRPDVLGADFEATTLALSALPPSAGPGGEDVATLVRHRAPNSFSLGSAKRAMLYVHGFNDYFFQRHVAEHFAARGYAFYAVDLRGYGRSLREDQLPNYVTNLDYHFEEINKAIQFIREDGYDQLTLLGHSTGGLISAMWAHRHRGHRMLDALVLNSPWLDLAENWFLRTVGTEAVDLLGQMRPQFVVRNSIEHAYGMSLHRDWHGEWDYNLVWKPHENFPVRAGWIRAVRRYHAILHRGLNVSVPVLVLHSARSLANPKKWSPEAASSDTVLNVAHMEYWAPQIGKHVSVETIDGGLHDLFLSAQPVREYALNAVDIWLDQNDKGGSRD